MGGLMGAKKQKTQNSGDWFYQLPHEKQIEYCSRLSGKKDSKYCTIDGKPKLSNSVAQKAEELKYIPDSEGQMTMNFSHEEEAKQLAMSETPKIEGVSVEQIEAIVEQDSTISEQKNDYYDREGDYQWAKTSEVENMGEDIAGAARHKRNSHKDWNSADAFTDLNMKVNKNLLEEENSIDFEDVDDLDLPKAYAIRCCMDDYPATVPLQKENESDESKLMRRKKYIDTYNDLVDKGEELLRNPEITPQMAIKEMSKILKDRYNEYKDQGDYLMANAFAAKYNKMNSGKGGAWDMLSQSYGKLNSMNPPTALVSPKTTFRGT